MSEGSSPAERAQLRLGVVVLAGAALIAALFAAGSRPAPGAMPAPGRDWATFSGTGEQHYSPLDQIDEGNVQRLGLVWAYDVDGGPNAASAPVAVDGVVYFAVGYSVIHAVDAVTGKLLWRYDPEAPQRAGKKMRAAWGIRGIAYARGRIFTGTIDGRLIALDAKTGRLAWSAQTIDPNDAAYITGAPWIAGDKVVIGFGGGDFGPVRGRVTAYDIASGKGAWRFYTVPGDPAKPDHAASDSIMATAAKTWDAGSWRWGGGGTVWNAMAYDAKLDRIYIGTGNGTPWNRKIRSPGGGDNLFLCAIVALDAKTGRYIWHYQVNPGESWDYNAAMDIELAELNIGGRQRSVILHAPKNGFFYVIDRITGKLISAEKFAPANWATRIDTASGRPVETPWARFPGGRPVVIFPSPVGAHAAEAMAYSPQTRLTYIPANDQARVYLDAPDLAGWTFKPGQVINNGIGAAPPDMVLPPGKSALLAWDPVAQKPAWRIPQTGQRTGAVTATGGGLIFQGQATGQFAAFAAKTGKLLWRFDAQNGVQVQPITYMAGNRQYVTVMASWRASGPSGRVPEYDYYTTRRRVLTFALDGKAVLPAPAPVTPFADDPAFAIDPALAASGKPVFAAHCAICHGPGAVSGGAAPDLRRAATPLNRETFASVLGGLLVERGMPRFEDLGAAEIDGLQHYIRQQARTALGVGGSPQGAARIAQEARRLHADQ